MSVIFMYIYYHNIDRKCMRDDFGAIKYVCVLGGQVELGGSGGLRARASLGCDRAASGGEQADKPVALGARQRHIGSHRRQEQTAHPIQR